MDPGRFDLVGAQVDAAGRYARPTQAVTTSQLLERERPGGQLAAPAHHPPDLPQQQPTSAAHLDDPLPRVRPERVEHPHPPGRHVRAPRQLLLDRRQLPLVLHLASLAGAASSADGGRDDPAQNR